MLNKDTANSIPPVNTRGADGDSQYPGPEQVYATPQRTAESLGSTNPTMEPVMVCGTYRIARLSERKCDGTCRFSTHTSSGVTFVIRVPIVLTIFQPPLSVPRAMQANRQMVPRPGYPSAYAHLQYLHGLTWLHDTDYRASLPP